MPKPAMKKMGKNSNKKPLSKMTKGSGKIMMSGKMMMPGKMKKMMFHKMMG